VSELEKAITKIEDDARYTATLIPYDAAGNLAASWTV